MRISRSDAPIVLAPEACRHHQDGGTHYAVEPRSRGLAIDSVKEVRLADRPHPPMGIAAAARDRELQVKASRVVRSMG